MGRFAAILLAVSGTVALPVVAQAVLQVSVRFIGRRTRGATELRRTFWIRSAPWCRCCSAIWHRWDCGLGSSSGSAHSRPTTMLYFSLVTFATLGYGDIVLTPGYRIFGALAATCGSLMVGWSTALIFAAISRAVDSGRA